MLSRSETEELSWLPPVVKSYQIISAVLGDRLNISGLSVAQNSYILLPIGVGVFIIVTTVVTGIPRHPPELGVV